MSFGGQLRRLRLRAGLTQEVLAERAGVSVATIGALEEDRRRRPYPNTVAALAEALGLGDADRAALLELASGSSAPPTEDNGREPDPASASSEAPPPAPQVRLPAPATTLIGRERDVQTAACLLGPAQSAMRLLTLVGPGGVGKTRLAVAVAGALVGAYPDGVVFVDLAPVRDHRLVPATIAHALGVVGSGGRSARELLLEHLHTRRLLLVPDNLEHLLGAAPVLAELLEGCSHLAVLVTSRAVLRLRSEQHYRVAPLPAPTDQHASLEVLAASPAVRLFVERAHAVAPTSRWTRPTPRPWPRSAGTWRACHWPSSWPPRACGCCVPRRCCGVWGDASRCSRAAPLTCPSVNRRCAPR